MFNPIFSSTANPDEQPVAARMAGQGSVPTNDDAIINSGTRLVIERLEDYYAKLSNFGFKKRMAADLLPSETFLSLRGIPQKVRRRVAFLRDALYSEIQATTIVLENAKFAPVISAVSEMNLKPSEKDRMQHVASAQEQMHVSYQSLCVALKVFGRANEELLYQLEAVRVSGDANHEMDLLTKNALLVYEIANAGVEILRGFRLAGREELLAIHSVMINELQHHEVEDRKLLGRATASRGNAALAESIRQQVQHRSAGRKIIREEWGRFISQIAILDRNTELLRHKVTDLELVRDNARSQLSFLQHVEVTRIVKANLQAVDGLQQIAEMKLAPVTPDDLCRLLGIGQDKDHAIGAPEESCAAF